MYKYENLASELKNKERTVKDLIRYIKNRTDRNPNYSLLLGAGCSITSGVRGAGDLIAQWKKEIFLEEKGLGEDYYDQKEADSFLEKKLWFDSRNPYSCLFENKYDLPRQRRMFVEQEVRNKTLTCTPKFDPFEKLVS